MKPLNLAKSIKKLILANFWNKNPNRYQHVNHLYAAYQKNTAFYGACLYRLKKKLPQSFRK